jgi:hypothetical protein
MLEKKMGKEKYQVAVPSFAKLPRAVGIAPYLIQVKPFTQTVQNV